MPILRSSQILLLPSLLFITGISGCGDEKTAPAIAPEDSPALIEETKPPITAHAVEVKIAREHAAIVHSLEQEPMARPTRSASREMNYQDHLEMNSLGVTNGILRFSHSTRSVKESGGRAKVTIARGNGTVGTVTVDYATVGGSATPDVDYTPTSGTLTFAEGEYLKTFTIRVLRDRIAEGNETVLLRISNPTGGALVRKGEDTSELKIED